MLPELLLNKMQECNQSLREVARAVGVSHTTIARALNGETLDLDTIELISKWLRIPFQTILEERTGRLDRNGQLLVLMGLSPRLSDAFELAFDAIVRGSVPVDLLDQLADYLSFLLSTRQGHISN